MTDQALADLGVRLVVLVPFLGAGIGLLVARWRSAARVTAVGAGLLTLAAAAYQLWVVHHDQLTPTVTTVRPLPVGALDVPLHLVMDDLSAIVAVAVALVGLTIQAYTRAYLHADPRYGTFAATMSLFLGGMLLVVQSGDLLLTLVGWEVMGWCSYLLIGHHSRREAARRASVKAFLVTRVADLAFVIGIVILAGSARSTDVAKVFGAWVPDLCADAGACVAPDSVWLAVAMLGLVCGVAGKSGLVPFHDWLPDAMEGPTPASALIHAATMVAAGTYVLARLFPVFAESDPARLVLAVLAAVTMVYAALLAFAQSDLKRLLAYSTLSQIAVMLSAVAVAPRADGPGAGVFHLLSHAMFKALLFLAIGWAAVLVGGTAAMALRGSVRWYPVVRVPLAIGLLSLAGVPPLVGFVSKEYVFTAALDGAESSQGGARLVLAALTVTIFLTAAYCMRAWRVLTHLTDEEEAVRYAQREAAHRPPEPEPTAPTVELTLEQLFEPRPGYRETATAVPTLDPYAAPPDPYAGSPDPDAGQVAAVHPELTAVDPTDVHGSLDADARVPVGVLALLTVVGGAIVFTPLVPGLTPHLDRFPVVLSVALVALAALAVWLVAARRPDGDAAGVLGSRVTALADRGLDVDSVYLAATRPVSFLARVVVAADQQVVDAYVRGAVVATRWAGTLGELAHTRKPSTYLVWLLLGLLAVGVAGVSLW